MKLQQWTNPTLSMLATLVMCVILSVSQDSNATSKHHQISVVHEGDEQIYHVDGKTFTFDQLSEKDKRKLRKLEKKLQAMEISLENDTERMEKWGEKMERAAEVIEREAEKLEASLERLNISDIENLSAKLEAAGRVLEQKMEVLEDKLNLIEVQVPNIDQTLFENLEEQARELESLLVKIAETI